MTLSQRAATTLAMPVPRALLRLALPILASQALRLAYQWVDALWVRGLGVESTAAITTSVFVLWWVYALNDVFCVGASAFVSQLVGSGDRARAGVTAAKLVQASALLGLMVSVAAPFVARPIFQLLDPTGQVVDEGAEYLVIVLLAAPLTMVAIAFETVMRAAGDTRTPLLLDLGAVLLNALLAPVLIYGWGPFPELGIAGAAWATAIAHATLVVNFVLLARRGHPALPFTRRAPGAPVRLAALARVGLPAALIGILFSVVYIVFARAASPYGAAAVAVVGIVNRVEALQFVLAMSLGLAAATLVGQALGSGQPDRAAEVIRIAQRWIVMVSLVIMGLFLSVPQMFLALFSQDPEVFRLGVPYLRILSLAAVATGLEIVTAEAVVGSGHTRVIGAIFTVVSLARIPLAFMVPQWGDSGLAGLAWLILVTCVLRAGIIVGWAARGHWRSGLAHELHGVGGSATAGPPDPSPSGGPTLL